MKTWQLISKNSLKMYEQPGKPLNANEVRIKLNKVLVTKTAMLVYDGTFSAHYPFTPCSYAVGRIAECGSTSSAYERNTRVAMKSSSENKGGKSFALGIDAPGYLKDFAVTTQKDFFVLPASVADDEALLLGVLSLCEAVIAKIKAEKGQFVIVSGGSDFSVIMGLLLLYHKVVPILIETDESKIEFAKKNGIFYAFKADENLESNVFEITGGRMCDGGIYNNLSGKISPSAILNLVTDGSNVAFAGVPYKSCNIDSSVISKKQLVLSGVYTGDGYEMTAINALANKAINLSTFKKNYYSFDSTPEVFEALSEIDTCDNHTMEIITV